MEFLHGPSRTVRRPMNHADPGSREEAGSPGREASPFALTRTYGVTPRWIRELRNRFLRGDPFPGLARQGGQRVACGALRVPPHPHRAVPRVVLPQPPREEGEADVCAHRATGGELSAGLLLPTLLLQLPRGSELRVSSVWVRRRPVRQRLRAVRPRVQPLRRVRRP